MLTTVILFAALAQSPAPLKTVAIVPWGEVNPALISAAKEAIEAHVNVAVRVDPPRELPTTAYRKARNRYRAELLLAALEEKPPEGAWKVVSLTEKAISTTKGPVEDWGIAGLGTIGGLSCVVSSYLETRHSRTFELAVTRFKKSVVHELGHTLGLPHCPRDRCVMADAKGKAIAASDATDGNFCSQCAIMLPRGLVKPRAESSPR